MQTSIIVPFHSNELLLRLCLAALIRTTSAIESEIIVVLNNRNPGALPKLRASRKMRPLYFEDDLGYSRAANLGAQEAKGDYLAFCDSDTLPFPGWVEGHLSKHGESRATGITSAKILSAHTGRLLDFGIGRTPYNHFHPFRGSKPDNQLAGHDRRVQMACSANMMISRQIFFELGMFDENLVHFYQDVDLCLRLKDLGRECHVLASSVAFHKGRFGSKPRPALQADERGYYTAKNIERFQSDFELYLTLTLESFGRNYTLAREYLLIDLSTINNSIFLPFLGKKFHIADTVRCPQVIRDSESICLLGSLSHNVIQSRWPLLFFVDSFLSLRHNSLWLVSRSNMSDLVIDRHANVSRFTDIVSGHV
jgi:GT2 family glycosyltransferase